MPGVLALVVLSLAVILLYARLGGKSISRWWQINFGNRILVIGLGEGNRAYIDSEIDVGNKNIIVIEMDKNHPYSNQYAKKVLVEVGDASQDSVLKELNFNRIEHIVISAGEDITNINIAKTIIDEYDDKANLFLHLTDRSLRHYHKENGVLSSNNIRVFSYYEESARELFLSHDIDGESNDIMQSDNAYAIAVIGDTILAREVVAQACIMGQLPNENKLTIYCIDKETKSFQDGIELNFTNISSVPNVNIEYKEIDYNTTEFYKQDFWKEAITNIILCYEDDQTNLDIAANLINLQFLEESVDKTMHCKIHIAMSDTGILSKSINDNNELFNNIHIFAQTKKVNSRDNIIAKERNSLAVAVDYIYTNIGAKINNYTEYSYDYCRYNKKWECVKEDYDDINYIPISDESWQDLSYFKKESNRAVADHMKVKLKYLGLKRVSNNMKNKNILYKRNRDIFDKNMETLTLLAKCEHNRWNTFHFLQGYKGIPFISAKDKENNKKDHESKKLHMCLVEFSDFQTKSKELEAFKYAEGYFEGFDVMIVDHIPHMLTYAGYALKQKKEK